ncbi:importin subunit alpha-1a-like protein [Tanacetum coccineum]
MPYIAQKAMEYLDKPAIHVTMTKAIEGPPGFYVIEVLTEGDVLALAPVGEQENGVKVQCPLEVINLRPRWRHPWERHGHDHGDKHKGKYEALILHGNDKNAYNIDKRIGSAIAQLEATTQFHKLLSIERSPPIEEVIQSGVVPRFVEFLMREDFHQIHDITINKSIKSSRYNFSGSRIRDSRIHIVIVSQIDEQIDAVDNGISRYETDQPPKYVNNTSIPSKVSKMNINWYDDDH